jgi:hypothetical protein
VSGRQFRRRRDDGDSGTGRDDSGTGRDSGGTSGDSCTGRGDDSGTGRDDSGTGITNLPKWISIYDTAR